MQWDWEKTSLYINKYRKKPILCVPRYNEKRILWDPCYNKLKKNDAWVELVNKMEIDTEECKKN